MMSKIVCVIAVMAVVASFGQSKPSTENLFYAETFDDVDPFTAGRWIRSSDEKYVEQPLLVKTLSNPVKGFETDKGVLLSQEMRHYAFSSKFPVPFESKGKDVVVQYELRLEEGLTCGGAYVKMPMAADDLDLSKLNSDTRYSIMFGPDKCGTDNKVHFILQHKNPVSNVWEEKHLNTTIPIKGDKRKTHLYTLHIKNNNDFEIYIDMKSASKGNLLTHMKPSINPNEEIDDETDKQPEDWVLQEMISDPAAVKPDDWDEEAPKMIEDESKSKPVGWADDAPREIPDPDSVKPTDWDDEEDGEWEAPTVPNPVCAAVGCGVWKRPTKKNAAYKGKWVAPQIRNDEYKGVWAPRKIPNPFYFSDLTPASTLAPMAGIAVEVWTTNAGIFFDNFVVDHSLPEAFKFASSTFSLKQAAENSAMEADRIQREKENAVREKAARAARSDITSRLMTKAEEFSQFLYTNAFASIGTFTAIMLCVVLASIEAQRRKASALKRNNAATSTAASATSTAAVVTAESVSAVGSVNGTAAATVATAEHSDQ